ncbi:hypothetical protein B0T22DRAFT_194176 [Podospora appendiculata]|uniref:Secreted protein n=1 Tax=Podospora appendiculata TaxID=314037 RepID=A0AAE0XDF8_9PEZI|nr:hypothetical protein B0T22DRAFT_194176 [Podospora appendiculata]
MSYGQEFGLAFLCLLPVSGFAVGTNNIGLVRQEEFFIGGSKTKKKRYSIPSHIPLTTRRTRPFVLSLSCRSPPTTHLSYLHFSPRYHFFLLFQRYRATRIRAWFFLQIWFTFYRSHVLVPFSFVCEVLLPVYKVLLPVYTDRLRSMFVPILSSVDNLRCQKWRFRQHCI